MGNLAMFVRPNKALMGISYATALLLGLASGPVLAQQSAIEVGKAPNQDVMALEKDGLEKALATLPAAVTEILKRSGVPGAAVAVVHDGKTIFARGFGTREIGKDKPVDPETVFQIASVSKSLTATIAATQVTNGLISWDDPVVRFLPDLKLSDPYVTAHATIGDFMAHRTGLPYAAGDDLEGLGFPRKEIIERIGQLPLDQFRTSYHYANFGTTIGAEAVAAAAGKQWEALAEEALFKPLGMTSTSARHDDFLARENRALLHAREGGRFQPLYDRDPDEQSAAGGVSSNVLDLAEWLKLLLARGQHQGKQLASTEALLPALSPHAVSASAHALDARSGFYGYGFNVGVNANGRTTMNHSGGFMLGAATFFQIIPSADLGIVVLTNGGPVGAAEAIGVQFMETVQYGKPTRDWYAAYNNMTSGFFEPEGDLAKATAPTDPQAAQPLSSYAGRYDSAYFGPAEIRVEEDRLVLTVGPGGSRFDLSHWDGDVFAVMPMNEDAAEGSRSSVRFSLKDGAATGFTVDYLNRNGMAVWQR